MTSAEQSKNGALALWANDRLLKAPSNDARAAIVRAANSPIPFLRRIGSTLIVGDNIGVESSLHDTLRECEGVKNLVINSGGGSGNVALEMHDALAGRVETVRIRNRCCSAAVAVAMAARHRVAESTAHFMIHPVQVSIFGDKQKVSVALAEIDSLSDRYAAVIANRAGRPLSIVNEWMSGEDRYFTASEALAEGLIDEIIEPEPAEEFFPKATADDNDDLRRVVHALLGLGSVRCDKFELMAELRAFVGTVQHTPASEGLRVFPNEAGSPL